ncbi:uncharacterized protein CLAFUR5_05223 [Fulvia fulva]|uniref:Uncharacterized protein n=1 Tax=Passalora fulva TaxID=5499 RepID=A0A9Q8P7X2_PASFU|nr:uncharacterized protein CLAFUR5_05223 [Fulvia fulva]KAK4616892.1 hypothetical protein CLAFUR0_10629 [Fulvia fulva]UJO16337.1 hypothetical protein CLAFUR5_05223 [Fulvia fulva]
MEDGRSVTPTNISMEKPPQVSAPSQEAPTTDNISRAANETVPQELWSEKDLQIVEQIANLDQTWEQVCQLALNTVQQQHTVAATHYRWQKFREIAKPGMPPPSMPPPAPPATHRKRKATPSTIDISTPATVSADPVSPEHGAETDANPTKPMTQRGHDNASSRKVLSQTPRNIKQRERIACDRCGTEVSRSGIYQHYGSEKCQSIVLARKGESEMASTSNSRPVTPPTEPSNDTDLPDAAASDETPTPRFTPINKVSTSTQAAVSIFPTPSEPAQAASNPPTPVIKEPVFDSHYDRCVQRAVHKGGYCQEAAQEKYAFLIFGLHEARTEAAAADQEDEETGEPVQKGSRLNWVEPEPHRLAAQADPNSRIRPQTFLSNIQSNMAELRRI